MSSYAIFTCPACNFHAVHCACDFCDDPAYAKCTCERIAYEVKRMDKLSREQDEAAFQEEADYQLYAAEWVAVEEDWDPPDEFLFG